jgi:hypothetical protein
MNNDDLKHEIAALKNDRAVLLSIIAAGRQLMNELAEASDGAVLAGEVFPDGLNERVGAWLHANTAEPLPATHRAVDAQMMKWAGMTVFVTGVAQTAPENWPLIDMYDTTPKSPGIAAEGLKEAGHG